MDMKRGSIFLLNIRNIPQCQRQMLPQSKGLEKHPTPKGPNKQAVLGILISNKMDFKSKFSKETGNDTSYSSMENPPR